MWENGEKWWSKLKMTSSLPQPKNIQFTVTEDLKKPENIHIWEAGIREFGHFFLKKWLKMITRLSK